MQDLEEADYYAHVKVQEDRVNFEQGERDGFCKPILSIIYVKVTGINLS